MPHASLIDINDLPLRHESLDRVWAVNGYNPVSPGTLDDEAKHAYNKGR